MKKLFAMLLVSVLLVTAAVPAFADTQNASATTTAPIYFNDFSKDMAETTTTHKYPYTAEVANGKLTLSRVASGAVSGDTSWYTYIMPDSPTLSGLTSMTVAVKFTPSKLAAGTFSTVTTTVGVKDESNFTYAGYGTGNTNTHTGNQLVGGNIQDTVNKGSMSSYLATNEAATAHSQYPFELDTSTEYIMIVTVNKDEINPTIAFYNASTGSVVTSYVANENTTANFKNYLNLDGKLGFVIRNGACEAIIDSYVAYASDSVDHSTVISQLSVDTSSTQTVGMQKSDDGSAARFIGVVKSGVDITSIQSFGFNILMTYDGVNYFKSDAVTEVYTSLESSDGTLNASDYGGEYFYVVEITGLSEKTVDFYVTGTMNGVAYSGGSCFTVNAPSTST